MTCIIRVYRDDLTMDWTAFWQIGEQCGVMPGHKTAAEAHVWAESQVYEDDEDTALENTPKHMTLRDWVF